MMQTDSVSLIIHSIKSCLEKGETVAAFYMALTLPDVCGKLKYPLDKPAKRYIAWFDEYIGNYEQSPLAKEDSKWSDFPYMSGKKMYEIRCALLHAGNNDLGQNFNLDEFLFDWNGVIETAGIVDINGKKKSYWRVNVRILIQKIIWATESFLRKENVDKEKMPKINEYGIDDIPTVFKSNK